jgi:hypothetical protein
MQDHEDDVDAAAAPVAARPPQRNYVQERRNRPGRVRAVLLEDDEDDEDDGDGWRAHTRDEHLRVHEAGHAVAAVDFGIPFECIVIYGQGREPATGPAQVLFACEENACWAAPNPVASLQFALAGMYAEEAVLDDDHYPDSGRSDIRAWHQEVGLDAWTATDDERTAVLGCPSDQVEDETRTWAETHAERIRLLAAHLAQVRETVDPTQNAEMSYDEVKSLAAQRSDSGTGR